MSYTEISQEQLQQIQRIASEYKNLECVECADAIKNYLKSEGVQGKLVKLYTGFGIGRDSFIYDESIPSVDAISLNGRHQGISIIINDIEIIFDNHHCNGIPMTQWIYNLNFYSKLYFGRGFDITEEPF